MHAEGSMHAPDSHSHAEGAVCIAAPGGMPIMAREGSHSPVPPGVAAPAAAAADDGSDHLLCIICLSELHAIDPIWSCEVCCLDFHLSCMASWLQESERRSRGGLGKCPGCQQDTIHSSGLRYLCWGRHVDWSSAQGPEGRAPAHSCGQICQRMRGHGCAHPCEAVCHRGRCEPCGNMREDVRCVGDHATYAPFPCGSQPAVKCVLPCGAPLACGHTCAAACHAGAHAVCHVPIAKDCACGKRRAASADPSTAGVVVPCSQQVIQCESICGKLRACGQHACQRRCHTGDCEDLMVVSSWGAKSWVKLAPSSAAVAPVSPAVAPGDGFPVLVASSVAAAPLQRAPSAANDGFRSCGKTCNLPRPCGHHCTQPCHRLASTAASASVPQRQLSSGTSSAAAAKSLMALGGLEMKEQEEKEESVASSNLLPPTLFPRATSSSSVTSAASSAAVGCESWLCTQLVQVSCPCGRKSEALKCHEVASRGRRLCLCDRVCAVHLQGRVFHDELLRTAKEDPEALGSLQPQQMLPYPSSMLSLLLGGWAAAGTSGPHALSNEANFMRKTEALIRRFVIDLAATMDHDEAVAAGSIAPTPSSWSRSSSGSGSKTPTSAKGNAAAAPATNVRRLFLSGLTPSRRLLVAQLALACGLAFNHEAGCLEAPVDVRWGCCDGKRTGQHTALCTSMVATPALSRLSSAPPRAANDCEERKENEAAAPSSAATSSTAVPSSQEPSPEILADPLSAASYLASRPAPPAVSFLLPSQSLADAAETQSRRRPVAAAAAAAAGVPAGPTGCTADSWPAALRVRLQVEGGLDASFETKSASISGEGGAVDDPVGALQRWLSPFATRCRACWLTAAPSASSSGSTSRFVLVLFASALTARQCYTHLRRTHSAELLSARVTVEAPAASTLPHVRALVAQEDSEMAALAREEAEVRRAIAEKFEAAQAKKRGPVEKPALLLVPTKMVGHSKLKVRSKNLFALLDDDEQED